MSDNLRDKLASALTTHRVECVMTAPDCFGWHCLTCGAEFHSWSTLEAAEQASLAHHADALMPVIRTYLREAWDEGNAAGWSDGGDANCAGLLPEDEHHNPWREDD